MWKRLVSYIKKIAKNSKKQFRNALSMVIAARIISCNLKVDWNIQNKCESKIVISWSWSNWKIALIIFAQLFSVHLYIEYLKVEHKSKVMVFQVVLVCAVQKENKKRKLDQTVEL